MSERMLSETMEKQIRTEIAKQLVWAYNRGFSDGKEALTQRLAFYEDAIERGRLVWLKEEADND